MENMPSEPEKDHPMSQPSFQPAYAAPHGPNPYILPGSILLAALIIAGSIIYLVQAGGGMGSGEEFPETAFSRCIDSGKHAAAIQGDYTNAVAAGVNSTPTTFVNGKMVTVTNPQTGETGSAGANSEVILAAIRDAVANPEPAPENGPLALTDRDVILGDPNAPVTVIEYGDYQCPFCARYFQDVEPVVRREYIDTGKVKMVFRNFQFLGPESVAAGEAAECAKEQGDFWEYHDALYTAEGRDGREHNGNLERELFLKLAQDLGLDAE